MRIKFDETMRSSNQLSMDEKNGMETAKRLARENEYKLTNVSPLSFVANLLYSRILDLLLDVNSSAQIPADKRIDLLTESTYPTALPPLSALPDLIMAEELAQAAEFNTPTGQAIYNEITSLLAEKAAERCASKPPKSLAYLMSTTPYLASTSHLLPPEVHASLEPPEGYASPLSYLTPDQMDDYIYDVEATLGHVAPLPVSTPQSPQHELALRNPHSVYNWLRRNEPKIFLQDGEGSEKSNGKPGSLRGAGKRMSMPAPSRLDALEIVEEDGMGYDPTVGGLEPVVKGKRKREREDDGGYHPKLGAPTDGRAKRARPRKKKSEGSADMTGSTPARKRAKARSSGDHMVVDEAALVPPFT